MKKYKSYYDENFLSYTKIIIEYIGKILEEGFKLSQTRYGTNLPNLDNVDLDNNNTFFKTDNIYVRINFS